MRFADDRSIKRTWNKHKDDVIFIKLSLSIHLFNDKRLMMINEV